MDAKRFCKNTKTSIYKNHAKESHGTLPTEKLMKTYALKIFKLKKRQNYQNSSSSFNMNIYGRYNSMRNSGPPVISDDTPACSMRS